MENNTFPDIYSVPSDYNQQIVCCAALPNGSSCTKRAGCVSNICSSGKCIGKPLGAVCTVNGACQTNICTAIGAERRCTKKTAGAVCGLSAECASNSCVTNKCQCSSGCNFSFTCAQGCALPAMCIDASAQFADYCFVKRAKGGACTVPQQCVSGVCSQGICTLKTSGATCTSSSECASNSCYAGVCQCTQSCVYNPTSCAGGCSSPYNCYVPPKDNANFCA